MAACAVSLVGCVTANPRACTWASAKASATELIGPQGTAWWNVDPSNVSSIDPVMVWQRDDDTVWWGPVGEDPEPLWSDASGLDLQLARRLLRTRGSAPVNERLNRDVDGTPAYVDRITRWTSAQVELRTLRLLLQRHAAA